jgi:cell shape-determining protein MreC
MSEWTEYDELAKMGDALKELREENQRLREALDAFVSEATLLPPIADAPRAWSDFVIEYINSYEKILENAT